MKFHRVEGKLPAGVSPSISAYTVPPPLNLFRVFDGEQSLYRRIEHLVSTEPTKISFDVPESAAAETARVLREMADELTK